MNVNANPKRNWHKCLKEHKTMKRFLFVFISLFAIPSHATIVSGSGDATAVRAPISCTFFARQLVVKNDSTTITLLVDPVATGISGVSSVLPGEQIQYTLPDVHYTPLRTTTKFGVQTAASTAHYRYWCSESAVSGVVIGTPNHGSDTSAGTELVVYNSVRSCNIPNNTQTVGFVTEGTGRLIVKEISWQCDPTGFAGPTNIEMSVDNVNGAPIGVDDPFYEGTVVNWGASGTGHSAITSYAFTLEPGKKLYIHGSDAVGTGAGLCDVVLRFQRVTDGASIAANDLSATCAP
jgi:hypothetical protein